MKNPSKIGLRSREVNFNEKIFAEIRVTRIVF